MPGLLSLFNFIQLALLILGIIIPKISNAQWMRKDTLFTEPGCQVPVHYPAIGSITSPDTAYYYFNNNQCSPSGGSNVHYKLFRTTNAFQDWHLIGTEMYSQMSCVDFVNTNTGFIGKNVFGFNRLMKTTDAGNTWITLDSLWQNANSPYYNIFMFNADSGYTVSYDGILKRINGTQVQTISTNTGVPVYYPKILFTPDNKGFMWSYTSTNSTFADPQLHRSLDNGITWNAVLTDTIGDFYNLKFADNNIGYLTSWKGIYKTIDGGASWNLLPNFNTYTFCLSVVDSNIVYVSSYDSIFRTTDGGINWQYQPLPTNTISMYRSPKSIQMLDSQNGYIIALNGLYNELYTTTNGGALQSIPQMISGTEYPVAQPNPADNISRIIFPSTYLGKKISINLFNITGKVIASIKQSSCENPVDIDLRALPSGLYLVQLASEGNTSIIKIVKK